MIAVALAALIGATTLAPALAFTPPVIPFGGGLRGPAPHVGGPVTRPGQPGPDHWRKQTTVVQGPVRAPDTSQSNNPGGTPPGEIGGHDDRHRPR
jgi:hypothetical protein